MTAAELPRFGACRLYHRMFRTSGGGLKPVQLLKAHQRLEKSHNRWAKIGVLRSVGDGSLCLTLAPRMVQMSIIIEDEGRYAIRKGL